MKCDPVQFGASVIGAAISPGMLRLLLFLEVQNSASLDVAITVVGPEFPLGKVGLIPLSAIGVLALDADGNLSIGPVGRDILEMTRKINQLVDSNPDKTRKVMYDMEAMLSEELQHAKKNPVDDLQRSGRATKGYPGRN